MMGPMRNAWLMGLLLFCAVTGGFILVQGRPAGDEATLAAALVAEAREGVQDVAGDLGLAPEAEPERESGSFYRYTDASGTMRFVTSLDEVPAALRDSARSVSNDRVQRAPPGPVAARPAKRPTREPFEAPIERAMQHEVVVYTTSWCGWCRKTLAYLKQQGVAFENRDIEAEDIWREELLEKTGGTSIPVVEIDGQIIRGYDPTRMAQLLRSS